MIVVNVLENHKFNYSGVALPGEQSLFDFQDIYKLIMYLVYSLSYFRLYYFA